MECATLCGSRTVLKGLEQDDRHRSVGGLVYFNLSVSVIDTYMFRPIPSSIHSSKTQIQQLTHSVFQKSVITNLANGVSSHMKNIYYVYTYKK